MNISDLRPGDLFVFKGDDQVHLRTDRIIECVSEDGQAVVYVSPTSEVVKIRRFDDLLAARKAGR